jgi:glycosyltransferase 2 family protein
MLRVAALFGLLGLAAATAIIAWSGYAQILQALTQAGWGIVWTSLFHLLPMLCCVIGWRALMPGKTRPSLGYFFYLLWLRSSVNNMMPVARIGGEVLAVRLMTKHGIRKTDAIASTVVELTLSVIAVFFFDVIGITMFAIRINDRNLIMQLCVGLLLSLPIIIALLFIQRAGFFGLMSKVFTLLFRERWSKLAGHTVRLDRAVHVMYRRKKRVLICGFWQFMSWCTGVGEIWLALYFMGHPMPLAEAFMLESIIQAMASAAFVVPGALGVQEGGFLLFGRLLGLSPDIAVALAVIRRCRDLILYVPGLLVWQFQEGRWLLNQHKSRTRL